MTKLSLLLKVLENETEETIAKQLRLFQERALPDLSNNIKCGNSLIGNDFYHNQQLAMFGDDERRKINAFDWESEFKEIFYRKGAKDAKENAGFDVVIGNPPYGASFERETRHYLAEKYDVPIPIADSFVFFLLKAFNLLNSSGIQGYILPSTWLYMTSYIDTRKYILSKLSVNEIILFREPVFEKATVETCIEIIQKKAKSGGHFLFKEIQGNPSSLEGKEKHISQAAVLYDQNSNLLVKEEDSSSKLFSRISHKNPKLGDLALIVCGLTPYRKGKGYPRQSQEIVDSRSFDSDKKLNDTYRQYLMGRDFHRYKFQIEKKRWISYGDWLAEPRHKAPFDDAIKIVVRQTADSIIAHIDESKYLSLKNVHNLRILSHGLSYKYLLGLLNSKLVTWWYQRLIPEKGRVFAEVKVINLEKLPIAAINLANPNEKSLHDKMVELVSQMLDLHKRLPGAKAPDDRVRLEREIKATDDEIDRLVYELYDLTTDEIALVDGERS